MSEQDTPMDALDKRLAAYLHGRAEAAAAFGPGSDDIAASIEAGAGRAVFPRRRAGTGLRGVPTLAWALLAMGMLAAMALALAAGSERDDGLVVLPPASVDPSDRSPAPAPLAALRGTWVLDFAASGIDDTYGGSTNRQPDGPGTFESMLWFGPGGVLRVWTGAVGGCETDGTWQASRDQVAITVPAGQNGCELSGLGPAAREIRVRLDDATTFALDDGTLTLRSAGSPSIVYARPRDGSGDPVPQQLWERGELQLDFAASGIDPTISSNGVATAVTSSIEFHSDGTVVVTVGHGEPCDQVSGTYVDSYWGLEIEVPVAPAGTCGDGPVYPDRQIRDLLTGVASFEFADDGAVRLVDLNLNVLLVYRTRPASSDSSPRLESIEGSWGLDFPSSGIDDTYGGVPRDDGLRFTSLLWLNNDGRLEVSSGAAGGCLAQGTFTTHGDAIEVTVPTGVVDCEDRGPGPAAREIRRRLSQATRFTIEERPGDAERPHRGAALTLLDPDGRRLLVYGRLAPTLGVLGPLSLDFEASGVAGYYTLNSGPKPFKVPIASDLEFGTDTVTGWTGGGGGCDSFTGTYRTGGWYALTIDVPTLEGHCGDEFPDLEIRRRLSRTAGYLILDETLQLNDAAGNTLLVYQIDTRTPAP